jgi:hypothetical protein
MGGDPGDPGRTRHRRPRLMPDQTSNIDTLSSSKAALITDLDPSYMGKDQYSHARNAVRNTKDGGLGTISNEPGNLLCFKAPYPIIGTITLPDEELLVFSTDGKSSEIGLADLRQCTYKTLKNTDCLSFSAEYPISGVAKKDFQKGVIATFTDKKNPVRRIELKKLGAITDCDDLLLFKKLQRPHISLKKGIHGAVPNGVYSVVIAYSIDGQVFSDYLDVTTRIMLHSETGGNAFDVHLSGLDPEFEEFTLVVVGNYIDPVTKGATKLAKSLGTFSTKTRMIPVTDFLNVSYKEVKLSSLIIRKNSWQKAGIISSNSNYLILGDLVSRPEEDYQSKAMSIEAEYVIEQVDVDYYETDGADVGYYGDENYDFYIQGIYNTGEETERFQIPGRKPSGTDKALASGADVYEYESERSNCALTEKLERWQVENTAGPLVPYNEPFRCGRRQLGHGKLGYFQSTDTYPDNKGKFGDSAGAPIRYHKFPDEGIVPRYSVIGGRTYLNIKGIRFSNIPDFDSPDIIGYKITRNDRKGGNGTVVARGLITNVKSYEDPHTKERVYFSNYGVNHLGPDPFLSATQTVFKKGEETNFNPLTTYHKDKFNFYSPHCLFEPRYSLGTELKIEAEEVFEVNGAFSPVYKHPKQKLLNQFSFWLSAAVGFVQSALMLLGRTDLTSKSGVLINPIAGGPYYELEDHLKIYTVKDLIQTPITDVIQMIVSAAKALDPTKISTIINLIKALVETIGSLGLKVPYSLLEGMMEADRIFTIIHELTGYTDYVYQYNGSARGVLSKATTGGNRRRELLREALYLPSDVVSIDGAVYNNYFREPSVLLELNKDILDPTTRDTSKISLKEGGACDTKSVSGVGSAYYASSKVVNPNQYGKLGSASTVVIHNGILKGRTTPVLWGGDCILTRFSVQKRMQFFNQNLSGTNYPDGTEYDYRLYRNIAYPRFWMDTTKYDFSALLSSNVVNYARFSRTTTAKHNLDCKHKNDGKSISRIDDAYMYLSHNTALDFIVECDYNASYRERSENPHYSRKNTSLSEIFRQDRLLTPEVFLLNRVYADIYTTEVFSKIQRDDFDPTDPIPTSQPNSVIYSLPSFNLQQVDNWRYFLPGNYFAFRESDFGTLTAIHKLDGDRILFLFSGSSPYVSMGRDFLQLEGSGRKVTIGDGGLFAQDPRELMPTDNNYGACNSRWAFANTHLGRFYPSERQGRILETDGLQDITRAGVHYWCKNYMPIKLYDAFPTYPRTENPIAGVGYLSVFDASNETVYFTKRDFLPKKEYIGKITYTTSNGFRLGARSISLRDADYFTDISWTLSYSASDKAFISWHDWHPEGVIQGDTHFMTIKGNSVWRHNEALDLFCNFYSEDFPFELELISASGAGIETLRSLEYLLEAYKYTSYQSLYERLNENISHIIVHNPEQISPFLKLIHGSPNPEENLVFPIKTPNDSLTFEVPFFKEENKYRVNMFWDSTRDRGNSPLEKPTCSSPTLPAIVQ